jgi:ELWxxDGT repeat protein
VYLTATGADGLGVWKSDGTEAGTSELATVVPTWGVSDIAGGGGKVYFIAAASNVPVLWVSDGTPQGTHPLNDSTGSPLLANHLVPFAGGFYFFGLNEDSNYQWFTGLYHTDGTPTGTALVMNVYSGQYAPTAVSTGNRLFFSNGTGVWTSDGTASGTLQLSAATVGSIAVVNGALFFTSAANGQNQLWESDGTAAGTQLVATIPSAPEFLTASGGLVYFTAEEQANQANELWKSDGTATGTVPVIPGTQDPGNPQTLVDVSGTLYFIGDDSAGQRLWKSDGTAAGTVPVANIRPDVYFSPAGHALGFNGELLFTADDGVAGDELWKSDGTSAGTGLVANINTGTLASNPQAGAQFGGKFVFAASNGLWATDGTDGGTTLLVSGQSGEVTAFNGSVYFTHYDSLGRFGLWRTDGTAAGTLALQSLYSLPTYPPALLKSGLTVVNGLLYYESTGANTIQVWRSNGTPQGTSVVASASAQPGTPFYVLGTHVLVDSSFAQLYSGSSSVGPGTYRASSNSAPLPQDAVAFNNLLYYISGTGDFPTLWQSDGTAAGTKRVTPLGSSGLTGSAFMTVFNGRMLFGAGGKLWASDGTAAGTLPIANLNVSQIRVSGGTAYVSADDRRHRRGDHASGGY